MSTLTAAFGALALVLAVVGLYGLMAYSVTQRTREIAIRSALGARQVDLMRLVIGKALSLALVGIVLGMLAAMQVARLLTGMLFGVTPADPATYTAAAALLIVVALAAGAVPAVRAARIDCTRALRN
jgi:putative ABC transport system permease protein